MTLSPHAEQELVEIRAIAHERHRRVRECLEQLEGINAEVQDGRDEAGALPLLAFVHIPKTAGATVTSLFAAAYSRKAINKAGNYMKEATARKISKRPGAWENWHRRGGRLCVGHVPLSLFRQYLPEDTRYMTFLREPVDRVLSHYYRHMHVHDPERVGRKSRGGRHQGRGKAASLEQALVEWRAPELNNLSTRLLCGHEPLGELPDSALDDAKDNLHVFAFIGIQERFEESLVLLQRMLGLSSITYEDRHVSVAGRRPSVEEVSDEQRRLIADYNRLDAELYRFGLGLFEEGVAAAADDRFAADVEALRARDSAARADEWRTAMVAPSAFRRKTPRPAPPSGSAGGGSGRPPQ